MNPNTHVSKHFTWNEVVRKSGYTRPLPRTIKLPNGSPRFLPRVRARKHARNLENLRTEINKVRAQRKLPETGIKINSWARSWEHNKEVGGAVNSQHLYFQATDITREEVGRLCPWKNGGKTFDMLANRVFSNGGFGTYPAGARHVDSRGYRARWSDWIGWRPGR